MHPLGDGLGGRPAIGAYERLARKNAVLPDVHEAIAADPESAHDLAVAQQKHRAYLDTLVQIRTAALPPSKEQIARVQAEGLQVANLHSVLALNAALSRYPRLIRSCLQRALIASPQGPVGARIRSSTLYALGCFYLQHGWAHKATTCLRRALLAIEECGGGDSSSSSPGEMIGLLAVRCQMNLGVALNRQGEHTASSLALQSALDRLAKLPSGCISDGERATLEGICRYNIMCCCEFSQDTRGALGHARAAQRALRDSSLPADHALSSHLGSAEAVLLSSHPLVDAAVHAKLHAACK